MSVSISGTTGTFTVTKQSGTFSSSGTLYIKDASSGTGTTYGSASVSAGASSASVPVDFSGYSGYPKTFFGYYSPSTVGGEAWVGPITVSWPGH